MCLELSTFLEFGNFKWPCPQHVKLIHLMIKNIWLSKFEPIHKTLCRKNRDSSLCVAGSMCRIIYYQFSSFCQSSQKCLGLQQWACCKGKHKHDNENPDLGVDVPCFSPSHKQRASGRVSPTSSVLQPTQSILLVLRTPRAFPAHPDPARQWFLDPFPSRNTFRSWKQIF